MVASTARMASAATPWALALRQAVAPTARQATSLRTQIMLGSKWICALEVHGLYLKMHAGVCQGDQLVNLYSQDRKRGSNCSSWGNLLCSNSHVNM